jgi:hypothetical protein
MHPESPDCHIQPVRTIAWQQVNLFFSRELEIDIMDGHNN